MAKSNYNKNVFLNCPFDIEYEQLFNAVIFTVIDCGYRPRCALEIQDAGEVRLNKIINIIRDCQFAIHDISRTALDKKHQLPRFNMPFELGLFMGAKHYGNKLHKTKNCLILESRRYSFQKSISDIAGCDIKAHKNNTKEVIHSVRNWLSNLQTKQGIPGHPLIQERYKKFQAKIPNLCKEFKLSQPSLEFNDYYYLVAKWLQDNSIN